jgi:hypothetical protein
MDLLLDATWLLACLLAPLVVVLLVAGLAGWRTRRRTRRRHRQATGVWMGLGDPAARQAWASAHLAHVRLARLEARVRDLEHAAHDPAAEAGERR